MLNFQTVSKETFLSEYWQKKPLLIKQALPDFPHPLTADELAGLAMEADIESKIISETPGQSPQWHLKPGPFCEEDFKELPSTHWTLLVQGVDRFIPEVNDLLDYFDFLPQWRLDDVMISYAARHGSAGPHYDNYDVFLYQASGRRKWTLTTKNCHENNALPNLDLRIMADFAVEREVILSAGDMLYLPPHVGHHGVSLDEDCLGYSFGYRSYQGQELWDSFGDYLAENKRLTSLYKDPDWNILPNIAEIPKAACQQAKKLMQDMLNDERQLMDWFARFATQPDQQAAEWLPEPLSEDEAADIDTFMEELNNSQGLKRDLNCRFACYRDNEKLCFFINGFPFDYGKADESLIRLVASQRTITREQLMPCLGALVNRQLIYALWKRQYLVLPS